mgnify:CR=1 FL=1
MIRIYYVNPKTKETGDREFTSKKSAEKWAKKNNCLIAVTETIVKKRKRNTLKSRILGR